MDQIIEAILKAIPFSKYLEELGLKAELSALISTIIIVGVVYLLVRVANFLLKRSKCKTRAIEDIKPQFDHLSIEKATQFYIPTQYQNASPSRQEEPGFTHRYIARNKLIPFFIKTAFNEKHDSERFYLILADSGMGKTTFMINLYLRYHSYFNHHRKYALRLFRFSNPDTINQIKDIPANEAKNTILLLDALDEDLGIISKNQNVSDAQAFHNRIDEIVETTKNFREIIITCRTQYFPGQEEDPYELKIKRPDEKGFYTLNKIYISPFNEMEVKIYLNRKFGIIPFINRKKKKRALQIVSKSKNLVMRPMLLSYIDYLIEDEMPDATTYEIYDTLVSKWLLREAEKRKGNEDRENFIFNLNALSSKAAIKIYLNWRREGKLNLTKEDAQNIAKEYNIRLKPDEVTGQSLLTCDGVGNWKFAHKSILEFFLAKEAYVNPQFLRQMNFKGMDMAKKFFEELDPPFGLVEPGRIFRKSERKQIDNKFRKLQDFYAFYRMIAKDDFENPVALPKSRRSYTFPNKSYKATFAQALNYCNALNLAYGYNPVYDKNFNFLDPSGNVTKVLSRIRGFRLPTQHEWEVIYRSDLFSKVANGVNLKAKGFSVTLAKNLIDLNVKFYNKAILGNYYFQENEWIYDENGVGMMDPISRSKKIEELQWDRNAEVESFVDDHGHMSFEILNDFNRDPKPYYTFDEAKEHNIGFRLIFIP